jgi:hypothetical protein
VTYSSLLLRPNRTRRTKIIFLVLFSILVALSFQSLIPVRSETPPVVFELELPDFQLLPSTQPVINVPSSAVNQVLVHILRPAADSIDYSAIRTSINGQASAPISEVVAGLRGKIVKIDLQRLPGYRFVNGRNTVEVWAQNRRGRMYYSSFVIKTATENWNDDFIYEVQPAPGARNEVPPQVVLLEPERAVEFTQALSSMTVRINGIATGTTSIVRVSVEGKNLQLKTVRPDAARQLSRVTNSERSVAFETTIRIRPNAGQIVIEAEDKLGSRTRVFVPLIIRRPGATPVGGQKYALIIGISRYKNNAKGIQNLEYADADARSIYEFLQQPAGGGFARENMLLLLNEQASTGRIREALSSFITRASANDLLLIFLASHGAPDQFAPQNLYVITYDTSVLDMPQTALPMLELGRYINQNVKSKRLVLLFDACHSAGLATEGVRNLANNLANLYLETLLYHEKGRAIITSSDVNETSRESQKWGNGHGVFTYYLLQGLKGSADTNGDRLVSIGEVFRYVRQKVRLDTSLQQNPRMLIGDNENLALSVASPDK